MPLAYRKPTRPTVYPSEIDLWIIILLLTPPLMTVGLAIYFLLEGNPRDAGIMLATTVFVTAVSALFTLPCRYILDEDRLSIRCGIFRFKLNLAEIERIEKSRSWMSGPALSLKRVLVVSNGRAYLISPMNRDDFIQDLEHAVADATPTRRTKRSAKPGQPD